MPPSLAGSQTSHMSGPNSVLVLAEVCNPIPSGEKSFPSNILNNVWVNVNVSLPTPSTQLSLEK